MEKPGRKRIFMDAALDVYYARISAHQARVARRLGEGNLSEGIRRAIDFAEQRDLKSTDQSLPCPKK